MRRSFTKAYKCCRASPAHLLVARHLQSQSPAQYSISAFPLFISVTSLHCFDLVAYFRPCLPLLLKPPGPLAHTTASRRISKRWGGYNHTRLFFSWLPYCYSCRTLVLPPAGSSNYIKSNIPRFFELFFHHQPSTNIHPHPSQCSPSPSSSLPLRLLSPPSRCPRLPIAMGLIPTLRFPQLALVSLMNHTTLLTLQSLLD